MKVPSVQPAAGAAHTGSAGSVASAAAHTGPAGERGAQRATAAQMTVTLWGTRGSIPAPGPETVRYGGNTSCVQVEGGDGTVLVLDAGTGIRRLGARLGGSLVRV